MLKKGSQDPQRSVFFVVVLPAKNGWNKRHQTNLFICLQHGFSRLKLLVTVTVLDTNHGFMYDVSRMFGFPLNKKSKQNYNKLQEGSTAAHPCILGFPSLAIKRLQSWVAAPWLSSANLMPTRIECFRNFSAHRCTQVSSCFCNDLCLKLSTQSLKHLSTSELYILKLQQLHRLFPSCIRIESNQKGQGVAYIHQSKI